VTQETTYIIEHIYVSVKNLPFKQCVPPFRHTVALFVIC